MNKGDYACVNQQAGQIIHVATNAVVVESVVGRVKNGIHDTYKYIMRKSQLERHPSPAVVGWTTKTHSKKMAVSHGCSMEAIIQCANNMKRP